MPKKRVALSVTSAVAATNLDELGVKNREICIYKRPRCCHPITVYTLGMMAWERVRSFLANLRFSNP